MIPISDNVTDFTNKKYFTSFIIYLCIAIFLVSLLISDGLKEELLLTLGSFSCHNWGILRIGNITSPFIHFDLWHLLGNIIVFRIFSRTLEKILGAKKYILLFVFFLISNAFDCYFNFTAKPTIGLSGVICSLFGFYIIFIKKTKIVCSLFGWPIFFKVNPILIFIVWVVLDVSLYLSAPVTKLNIAHWSHLYGSALGLIVGGSFNISRAKLKKQKPFYS